MMTMSQRADDLLYDVDLFTLALRRAQGDNCMSR